MDGLITLLWIVPALGSILLVLDAYRRVNRRFEEIPLFWGDEEKRRDDQRRS